MQGCASDCQVLYLLRECFGHVILIHCLPELLPGRKMKIPRYEKDTLSLITIDLDK